MIKKSLKILFFILGCCIIFTIAIASKSDWLDSFSSSIPDPYRYGDLFMLSSMPGYEISTQSKLKPTNSNSNKNTCLTIIGDSYTDKFDSSFFNSGHYRFIHWDKIPDTIPALNKSQKNIIIIECTERYLRWRFLKNNLLVIGKKQPNIQQSVIRLSAENNLQYMFTYFDWEFPFKKLKTEIYLRFFNRFSNMVAKPDGSGRLYLSETVDPQNSSSSFNPVSDSEIKKLVENINTFTSQLTAIGFDEVYITIVPNAASIYMKSVYPYNHLIERIEQNPEVKFKFIDVYDSFKQEKKSLYYCNDSHWNDLGKTIWLSKTNAILNGK